MQAPRQHIYTFAHRVLVQDAHGEAGLWKIITGDKAYGYLERRWADAGAGAEPMTGMLWVEPIRVAGLEISLLRMPEPQAPTEPYFVAFVRSGIGGPLRYFVLERSSTGGAFWAEWRAGGMRIRGADVPEYPADLDARARIPYPYAAAFVDAIVAEAGSASAGGISGRKKAVLIGIAVAVSIVALVMFSSLSGGTSSEARREPVASTVSVDAAMPAAPVIVPEPSALPVEQAAEPEAAKPAANKRAPDSKQSKAGIEPNVIRQVIKRRISALQYCYDKALLANATLTGKITITFTIDADGKATEISTSGLDGIRECVTQVLEKTSFPNPSHKPQKVVYPITFKSQ